MSRRRWVDAPPNDARGWRAVWGERREYRGKVGAPLFSAVARAFETLLHPWIARQRDFNIVVSDLLEDLRSDLDQLRRDFVTDRDELREAVSGENRRFNALAARGDALVAALDQKIESIDARVRDISLPRLAEPSPQFRDDWTYRRMEEALRGSPRQIAEAAGYYAELAAGHAPVLDLGCGRGEFLDVCARRGIPARGIDANERSVAELRSRGLDVALGGIPDSLEAEPGGELGSILASHVVEHLPFSPLVGMFAQAHRLLRTGGLLMIETPNAGSIAVSAGQIWNDPTHVAPRPAAALVVIARETGFEVQSIETVNPFQPERRLQTPDDASESMRQLVERLNTLIFGEQDLRLILRKA